MRLTASGRLRLDQLRRLAPVPVLLVCADIAAEETGLGDPLPRRADFVLVLVAIALGVAALLTEVLAESSRRRLAEDSAELAARRTAEELRIRERNDRRARVERVLEGADAPEMVFQPIVDLASGTVVGYEALSRFPLGRRDVWFARRSPWGSVFPWSSRRSGAPSTAWPRCPATRRTCR
jgi:hypothetical protein